MKKNFFMLFFLASAGYAHAHETPLYPVSINLTIERSRILLHAESHGSYWQVAVLHNLKSLPATNWPVEFQQRAQGYFEKSFDLSIDKNKLSPRAFNCRYTEEPLREFETNRVIFDAEYPLSALTKELSDSVLTGKATFFIDEYVHDQKYTHHHGGHREYVTTLTIVGEKAARLTIPIEKPDFSIPLKGFVRTDWQVFWDGIKLKVRRLANEEGFWLTLVGMGLLLWPRPTSFRRWAGAGLLSVGLIKLFFFLVKGPVL